MRTRLTISVSELALRCRVSYQVALDKLLRGEVQGFRDGRSWRIYADSVDAALANREQPSAEVVRGPAPRRSA